MAVAVAVAVAVAMAVVATATVTVMVTEAEAEAVTTSWPDLLGAEAETTLLPDLELILFLLFPVCTRIGGGGGWQGQAVLRHSRAVTVRGHRPSCVDCYPRPGVPRGCARPFAIMFECIQAAPSHFHPHDRREVSACTV